MIVGKNMFDTKPIVLRYNQTGHTCPICDNPVLKDQEYCTRPENNSVLHNSCYVQTQAYRNACGNG